jgi:hypothetical protein
MSKEIREILECTDCGWIGFTDERATKQDDIWTTYICPECSCESFYNKRHEEKGLALDSDSKQ